MSMRSVAAARRLSVFGFYCSCIFLWENYGIVYWNTGSIIITLKTNTKKYGSFVKAYLEKEKAKLRGKDLKGKKYYHKAEIILT